MIHVTVWNENLEEKRNPKVKEIYPDGIHGMLTSVFGRDADIEVRTATMDEPEQGLPDALLEWTDVLVWWAHMLHDDVKDELVAKIIDRVLRGMGLIVLHSAHMSKVFRRTLGASGTLSWRDVDRERIWCCDPSHPIAQGVPESFVLEREEMYGEPFGIPNPESVVFLGWYRGGEVFRCGCTFRRGAGKIFYFQPGHEDFPTYHDPIVQRILSNAVHWTAPAEIQEKLDCRFVETPPEASYPDFKL